MGGQDKGLMDLGGAPIIDRILDQLKEQTPHIIISANRNLDQYQTHGYPVIPDETPDYPGPLAGVSAALNQLETRYIVTLPCDAPNISPDYIARLARHIEAGKADIAVCHDGERMQPLHAMMSTGMRDNLAAYLASDQKAVNRWFRENGATLVDFSDCTDMFANFNSPEQYQEITS